MASLGTLFLGSPLERSRQLFGGGRGWRNRSCVAQFALREEGSQQTGLHQWRKARQEVRRPSLVTEGVRELGMFSLAKEKTLPGGAMTIFGHLGWEKDQARLFSDIPGCRTQSNGFRLYPTTFVILRICRKDLFHCGMDSFTRFKQRCWP